MVDFKKFMPGGQNPKVNALRPINPSRIRRLENDIHELDNDGMVVATIK